MSGTLGQLEMGIQYIRQRSQLEPKIGLVLGSGLGFLADQAEQSISIPYRELPGFPISTVAGHAGRLVMGTLGFCQVAIMQGRFHYYEGYSMEQVVLGVRLLAKLGIKFLIITNAAGAIRKGLDPGDLMLITDHINLMGGNPLIGSNDDSLGPRFPDMSDAYGQEERQLALRVAKEQGILLHQGVYAAFSGPSYETPAEIRMLRTVGADAVGMSTIPEVIAASHLGLKVIGISCISNLAAGISKRPLSHDEVRDTTERAKGSFSQLILGLVNRLGEDRTQ